MADVNDEQLARVIASGLYERYPQCFGEFRVTEQELIETILAILKQAKESLCLEKNQQ